MVYIFGFIFQIYYWGVGLYNQYVELASLNDRSTNAYLFINFFESVAYIVQFSVYFTDALSRRKVLQVYCSKLAHFSKILPSKSKFMYNTKIVFKAQLAIGSIVICLLLFILTSSQLTENTFRFNFTSTVNKMKSEVLPWENSENMEPYPKDMFLVAGYIIGLSIVTIKDFIMALELFMAVFIYFLICSQFNRVCCRMTPSASKSLVLRRIQILRKIYKLARIYNRLAGKGILLYVNDFLLYCALVANSMTSYGFSVIYNGVGISLFISTYFIAAFASGLVRRIT